MNNNRSQMCKAKTLRLHDVSDRNWHWKWLPTSINIVEHRPFESSLEADIKISPMLRKQKIKLRRFWKLEIGSRTIKNIILSVASSVSLLWDRDFCVSQDFLALANCEIVVSYNTKRLASFREELEMFYNVMNYAKTLELTVWSTKTMVRCRSMIVWLAEIRIKQCG